MNRRILLISGILLAVLVIVSFWNVFPHNVQTFQTSRGAVGMMDLGTVNNLSVSPGKMMNAPSLESYPLPPSDGSGSTGVLPPGSDRLLIKTGQMTVVVDSVETKAGELRAYVGEKKGFIVSSQIYDMDTTPRATVTLRIPASEFEGTVSRVRQMGTVKEETVNGQDVTEEFIDLDAQLKNYQATESQFLEIMKKAVKIEDILSVQRELMNVRSSIEGIQGRMKYLRESSDYSTLTVYFSGDSASLPVLDKSDDWKIVGVFRDALRSLVEVGKNVVSSLIWLVVYLPVWGLVVLITWLIVRHIRRGIKMSK